MESQQEIVLAKDPKWVEMKNEEKIKKIVTLLKDVGDKAQFEEEFDWESKVALNFNAEKNIHVWKLQNKKTNRYYAIKVFNSLKDFDPKNLSQIMTLRKIKHSNIMNYQNVYTWKEKDSKEVVQPNLVIKMEYCDRNLSNLIETRKGEGKTFTDMEILWFLKQGLDVILFLETEYKTHLYNIKPKNIFVNAQGVWKFSDFGMAQSFASGSSVNPTVLYGEGSTYLAPEYLQALKANQASVTLNNEKCDIFSLGMIMLQCVEMLQEDELNALQINRIKTNITDVSVAISKALKNKQNKLFNEVIKKMCAGPFENRLKVKEIRDFLYKRAKLDKK